MSSPIELSLSEKEIHSLLSMINHYLEQDNLAMAEGFIHQYVHADSTAKNDEINRAHFCALRLSFITRLISKVLSDLDEDKSKLIRSYDVMIQHLRADYLL